MRESAGRRVHAYAAGTLVPVLLIVVQPPRTLNPEFGQQCSRPVTQKRKSAVLSIQWLSMYIHVYIFELHQI